VNRQKGEKKPNGVTQDIHLAMTPGKKKGKKGQRGKTKDRGSVGGKDVKGETNLQAKKDLSLPR